MLSGEAREDVQCGKGCGTAGGSAGKAGDSWRRYKYDICSNTPTRGMPRNDEKVSRIIMRGLKRIDLSICLGSRLLRSGQGMSSEGSSEGVELLIEQCARSCHRRFGR